MPGDRIVGGGTQKEISFSTVFLFAHFTTAQVFEFTFQAKVGWKFESRWEAQNFPCCQHFLKISYDLGITKM